MLLLKGSYRVDLRKTRPWLLSTGEQCSQELALPRYPRDQPIREPEVVQVQ